MEPKKFQPPQTPDELFQEVGSRNLAQPKPSSRETWAAYVRLSREEQHRYQYSKDTQRDEAEAYAKKHGSKQVLVYKDWDYSGKNSKRPEFQRLLRDIKAGRVDVVVVHRLDRLYRNLESLLRFIRLLNTYHVRLVSVTEQINTDTWWGRLVLYILGALAEMWVWQTSERTITSLSKRARNGLPLGDLPLGYCNGLCSRCTDPNGKGYCPLWGGPDRPESQGGRIPVPHPVDRYAIVWITQKYHEHMSYREIADYLNFHEFSLPDGTRVHFRTRGKKEDHKKPIEQQDRSFKRDSIRIIIRNIFYAGYVARYPRPRFSLEDNVEHPENIRPPKPQGNRREIVEQHPGQHEPLISLQLWEENQAIRKGRRHSPQSAKRKARIYPLTGVGRCWECLQRDNRPVNLRGTRDHGQVYYRCAYIQESVKQRGTYNPKTSTHTLETRATGDKAEILRQHKRLHARTLEAQVNALVTQMTIPEEWHETILAYYLSDDGITEFEYEGYNLRQALKRTKQLYRDGRMTKAELDEESEFLIRQLEMLKPSVQPDAWAVRPMLDDFPALWSQLNDIERRRLLDIIFAGLYFDREGRLRKIAAHSPFDSLMGLPEGGTTIE